MRGYESTKLLVVVDDGHIIILTDDRLSWEEEKRKFVTTQLTTDAKDVKWSMGRRLFPPRKSR